MSRHRRHSSLLLSIIPATIVVASLLAPGAAVAAPVSPSAPQGSATASPLTTLAEAAKAKAKLAADQALRDKLRGENSYTAGKYIVTLRDSPAATYTGGVKSFARTQPKAGDQLNARSKKVVDYSAHLTDTQVAVAKDAGVKISQQYTIATNGFASTLTAAQAKALAEDPRVQTVTKSELLHIQAEPIDSGVHFLGLDGATGVWSKLGGFENAGKGIVIGELDTGIAPENTSFAGAPLEETAANGEPTRDAKGIITFKKANGELFTGKCETGVQFDASDCNTKIIGAHFFAAGFGDPAAIGGPSIGEYMSPRDGQGHGSHTASTAAGNHGVAATVGGKPMGDISGVAPAAKISVYKVCWSGTDPKSSDDDGCSEDDSLAAIDQAIKDGVDVINYSIGGGAAKTTISTVGAAYLNAAVAGIFVAAAAGNSGPDASTLDNAAPWVTTVAASTIHAPAATATLGDGTKLLGVSITVSDTPLSGALVAASTSGVPGAVKPELCGAGTLSQAKVEGKIVFCERGTVDRTAKAAEIARVKGIGMLLVNPIAGSLDPDLDTIPTVHLDYDAIDKVRTYAATAGATVTFTNGNTTGHDGAPTPQIAGFSSRGPLVADGGDLIKPDLTAPGVGILAATNNPQDATTGTYAFESGTSMATPHVAGLAAIYLSVHPGATPAEVKSALMTTSHDLVDATGKSSEDVFAQGAGEVDPTKFLDPGLLYLNGKADWYDYAASLGLQTPTGNDLDPSDLNLASIGIGALPGTQTVKRTVTSTHAGTFTVDPITIPGITTVVSPSSLTFANANESKSFTVTFTRTDAALDVFATGYMRWHDGNSTVTSALAVRPSEFSVPADVTGTGNDGSVTIPVTEGVTDTIGVQPTGMVKGTVVKGTGKADLDTVPQNYVIEVPAGATFTRFDLSTDRDDVDLDMTLGWVGGSTALPIPRGQSITDSADERVDIPRPDVGRWVVSVYAYTGTGPIDYTLSTYSVTPDDVQGDFTADPESLDMVQATVGSEKVSWSGLDPNSSYLGLVNFGGNGAKTVVTVATDAAGVTPSDPSAVTLDIQPHFVRAGQNDVAMVAAGLDADESYSLTLDGASDVLSSGTADSAGNAARYITIPKALALGEHTATLDFGDSHSVSTKFVVADLTIYSLIPSADQNFGGKPAISLEADYIGAGTLGFSMTSEDGKTSYLTQAPLTVSTPDDPISDIFPVFTDVGHPEPGIVKASVWVIEPDGSRGQQVDVQFTVDATSNGSATFTQDPDNPAAVNFTLIQNSAQEMLPTFIYKLCSGPMNFAEYQGKIGKSDIILDMTGVVSIKAVLGDKVLASYINRDASRCEGDGPTVNIPLWVQASDTSAADPAKPIKLTISNTVPTRSNSIEVIAGNGTYVYSQPRIFDEMVPIDYSTVPNQPPVIRTLDVAENGAVWTRTEFEAFDKNGGHGSYVRRALVSALTPAMLAAIDPNAPIPADPTDPSTPGDPGTGSGSTPAAGGPKTGLAATGVAIGLPIVAGAVFALLLGSVLVIRRRRTVAELIVDAKIDESD